MHTTLNFLPESGAMITDQIRSTVYLKTPWMLAGRRVGIYIEEGAPLLFFDPETRELLRTRPNPLQPGEAARL